MKVNQKKQTKTIYFTDVKIDKIDTVVESGYHVFDRKNIISHRRGIDRDVFNHFNNMSLEQEFISVLKNKKISDIIYILHYNNPDTVLSNLKNVVIPKIKNHKNIDISFKYITMDNDTDLSNMNLKLYSEIITIVLDK